MLATEMTTAEVPGLYRRLASAIGAEHWQGAVARQEVAIRSNHFLGDYLRSEYAIAYQLDRLRTLWAPRRATLLLADAGALEILRPCLTVLAERSASFRHPVRWLWVGGEIDLPAQNGLAVQRFSLA